MSTKDWTGNARSTFATIGASNHSDHERAAHDFYATEPAAIDRLFAHPAFRIPERAWECACGAGHLSEAMKRHGVQVFSSDLVERGYGVGGIDFLEARTNEACISVDNLCVITNPPYRYATEFVLHALDLMQPGDRAVFLLNIRYLEGKRRYDQIFSKHPPSRIYQFISRIRCAINGDFEAVTSALATAYAWFEWEYDVPEQTTIFWI